MQLELLLIRHAEAFSDAVGGDHVRPLTAGGQAEAKLAGAALVKRGLTKFVGLSSDARRAKETAAAVGAATGVSEWSNLRELYLAGIDAIAEAARDLDGQASRLLAVGHNPGWSEAVYVLSGRRVSMGTAAIAWLKIDAAANWNEAIGRIGEWELVELF